MSASSIEFILKSGGVLLEPVSKIARDPSRMVPSNNMHLGYVPLTGDEAFELERKRPGFHIDTFTPLHNFRIARGAIECERLVGLCYKFLCLNRSINIIAPKEEYLNSIPRKSIFETTVIFNGANGKQATIQIYIRTSIRKESEREVAEYVINTNRLCGNNRAHDQLFIHLKSYIESDGHIDPRIRSTNLCDKGNESSDES